MTDQLHKEGVAPERKFCTTFESVECEVGGKKTRAFFGTYAALEFEPDGGEVCIVAPTPDGVGGPFYALTFCDCDMTKTREVAIVDAKAFRELVNFISEAQRDMERWRDLFNNGVRHENGRHILVWTPAQLAEVRAEVAALSAKLKPLPEAPK
jgi:hypothetical protein